MILLARPCASCSYLTLPTTTYASKLIGGVALTHGLQGTLHFVPQQVAQASEPPLKFSSKSTDIFSTETSKLRKQILVVFAS